LPVPPRTALHFAIVLYYLLCSYRSGGCHSGGGGGIAYRSPKRALRKNFEDFPMKIAQFQYYREAPNPGPAKRPAPPPKEMPPRRFNYLKTPPLVSQEPYGCQSYLHNFSWLGENHSRSCPFLLSRIFPFGRYIVPAISPDAVWERELSANYY